MPTCDFFSSTNHYQSRVQSFGKVLTVFRNFFTRYSVDIISTILEAGLIWVYWDFVMNCVVQELAMAPKSKQKWK